VGPDPDHHAADCDCGTTRSHLESEDRKLPRVIGARPIDVDVRLFARRTGYPE